MSETNRVVGDEIWRAKRLEWPITSRVGPGLSGAVAGGTRVAGKDPQTGRVVYRHRSAVEIAHTHSFEAAAFLLITGEEPDDTSAEWIAFREAAQRAQILPDAVREMLGAMPTDASALAVLRAAVSMVGSLAGEQSATIGEADIIGAMAGTVAAMAARRRNVTHPTTAPPIAQALALAFGIEHPRAVAMVNTALVAIADDDLEPATFAALVVTSCLADPFSAVVAGLSGLHGRWKFGTKPGTEDGAESGTDDRVAMLAALADEWPTAGEAEFPGVAGDAVASMAGRLLARMGIGDADFIAATLAIGRVAGMLARMREYRADVRIFRPFANYVGPAERAVGVEN